MIFSLYGKGTADLVVPFLRHITLVTQAIIAIIITIAVLNILALWVFNILSATPNAKAMSAAKQLKPNVHNMGDIIASKIVVSALQ